jgi:WD40 repeat protein
MVLLDDAGFPREEVSAHVESSAFVLWHTILRVALNHGSEVLARILETAAARYPSNDLLASAIREYELHSRQTSTENAVAPPEDGHTSTAVASPRAKFGGRARSAWPKITNYRGYSRERRSVRQALRSKQCRVLVIEGIGGIGKTHIVDKVVGDCLSEFDNLYFQSLRDAPALDDVLSQWLAFLEGTGRGTRGEHTDVLFQRLVEQFSKRRTLLVLDNFESVFDGEPVGKYRQGFRLYGALLEFVAESPHGSCVVVTTRATPPELAVLSGTAKSVRVVHLSGLNPVDAGALLKLKGVSASPSEVERLTEFYRGNPLALTLVSDTINSEPFLGSVDHFLQSQYPKITGRFSDLLAQQFDRLSTDEQAIMYWLAVNRGAVPLEELERDLLGRLSHQELMDVRDSLQRRDLVQPVSGSGTLQNVIMEYVTDRIVAIVWQEIERHDPNLLLSHGLQKTTAPENVRRSQARLILEPIIRRISARRGLSGTGLTLTDLLPTISSRDPSGYGAGNILNLLRQLRASLSGIDLSGQTIRRAWLQGLELQNVNLENAEVVECLFTETFDSVLSVAFNSAATLLCTGSANGDVRVWHLDTWQPVILSRQHRDWVWSVSFAPKANLIASGSADQTVKVWDVELRRCIHTLAGNAQRIFAVAWLNDGRHVVSAGEDGTVRIWDAIIGESKAVLTGHSDKVWCVAVHPTEELIASGSEDGEIRLWQVDSEMCIAQFYNSVGRVRTLAFDPTGAWLASGCEDGTVRLWPSVGPRNGGTLVGRHVAQVTSVAFSPDGKYLASAGEDQKIRTWSIDEGTCINTFEDHTNKVLSVAFTPTGELASGGDDQAIRLWSLAEGCCTHTLQGYVNPVWSVAFTPHETRLVSGSEDGVVRMWSIEDGRCLGRLEGHSGRVWAVAVSPNGVEVASSSEDNSVRIWDLDGSTSREVYNDGMHTRSISFSPDGSLIASGGADASVRVWETDSMASVSVLRGHTSWVRSVAFSQEGLLVSGSEDGTVRIWDPLGGKCILVLDDHKRVAPESKAIWAVATGPTGLLASASRDRTVRVWRVVDGACIAVLRGHKHWVRSVAFSPDGRWVASSSEDRTVRLWFLDDLNCGSRHTLAGHQDRIISVAFSADSRLVASASQDQSIRVWDVETGKLIKSLHGTRPYEGLYIGGTRGLTSIQRDSLKTLGAVE